jgi:hypothetical protein
MWPMTHFHGNGIESCRHGAHLNNVFCGGRYRVRHFGQRQSTHREYHRYVPVLVLSSKLRDTYPDRRNVNHEGRVMRATATAP